MLLEQDSEPLEVSTGLPNLAEARMELRDVTSQEYMPLHHPLFSAAEPTPAPGLCMLGTSVPA